MIRLPYVSYKYIYLTDISFFVKLGSGVVRPALAFIVNFEHIR